MNVPLWLWLVTAVGLAVPVAVDVWRACRPHPVGFVEAAVWSAVYVGIALLFGVAVLVFAGPAPAMEFFTGFVVEKALSVDNLFVFALVLGAFAVPVRHQSKVLLIGILGALAQRVVFIVAGAAALQRFSVLFLGFGVLLCYLAIRLLRSRGVPPDVRNGRVMRWARRRLPIADGGDSLVIRCDGRLAVTGLGLAVLAILSVDLVFALDSVPAIFGITRNLYLVLCTNAFALLGLRALYFVLAALLDRLVHLHYGLSIVLGLIGVKLVLHYLHSLWPAVPEIPTWLSLVLILAVFATTTVTSLRTTRVAAPHYESARE
jgi:tellurite resistance protein TerC